MVRKREERQSESNKQTGFRVRGRPVKEEKIQRYISNRPKELAAAAADDVDMDRNMSPAGMILSTGRLLWINYLMRSRIDTPAGISYYTPSDTGPLPPQEASSPQTSLRPHSDTDAQHSANYQVNINFIESIMLLIRHPVASLAAIWRLQFYIIKSLKQLPERKTRWSSITPSRSTRFWPGHTASQFSNIRPH
jgi:hypothetical protein